MTPSTHERIPVGISACLMGENVRFNGSHKRSRFCTDVLSRYFDFRPVCPEVAIGLGTPREPIRLVASSSDDESPRAVGVSNPDLDVTAPLSNYADQCADSMQDLCGFILMQKSPSCGLFEVKRYLSNGHPEGKTAGVFARRLRERLPLLPIEEAGRLNDAALRENFMVRVYAYQDWQTFLQEPLTAAGLIAFHSRYKYLVMAHSPDAYRSIGRLLSDLSGPLDRIASDYFAQLMTALAKPATRQRHTNALMHLQGYLKKNLSSADKHELRNLINEYHEGIVPLVVPLTLLKHHLNHHEELHAYARQQVYLNPHPYELGLRNTL